MIVGPSRERRVSNELELLRILRCASLLDGVRDNQLANITY